VGSSDKDLATQSKLLESGLNHTGKPYANISSLVASLAEASDKAPSEVDFRTLVSAMNDNPTETVPTTYQAMAQQDFKTITTVALKTLILTHKLQLYCPFVDLKPLATLYSSVKKSWDAINDQRIRNPKD
jgi:hypothetical protein